MAGSKKREVGAGDALLTVTSAPSYLRVPLAGSDLTVTVWPESSGSVTTTLPRSPPIAGARCRQPSLYILLALNHDDAAGRIGHLIDRREVDMIVWLVTRPPAPSSTVRTMLSVSPLATWLPLCT